MRSLTATLLVASLLLAASGCRGGGEPAGKAAVPAGWRVENDPDLTLAVPPDWRNEKRTSAAGNEFVSFLSLNEVQGVPQKVGIGRTEDVSEQSFDSLVDIFREVQGDRTFGARRDVRVEGSRKAVLLESTRPVEDKPFRIRAWNLFVLSPSSVGLNVEFYAPEAIFDEALMTKILQSFVVHRRGLPSP